MASTVKNDIDRLRKGNQQRLFYGNYVFKAYFPQISCCFEARFLFVVLDFGYFRFYGIIEKHSGIKLHLLRFRYFTLNFWDSPTFLQRAIEDNSSNTTSLFG